LNIIEKLNIESIGDLICYSSNVLLAQPNFGVRSLAVIETALSEINLKLAE
jgi:DNA-directed RNA polymerase alpha subunit